METNHSSYKPEDFWPDAEQMLDRHFARKARWRRFRVVGWSFLLLLAGGGTWFFLRPDAGKSPIHTPKQIAETKVPRENASVSEASGSTLNMGAQPAASPKQSSPRNASALNAVSGETLNAAPELAQKLNAAPENASSPSAKNIRGSHTTNTQIHQGASITSTPINEVKRNQSGSNAKSKNAATRDDGSTAWAKMSNVQGPGSNVSEFAVASVSNSKPEAPLEVASNSHSLYPSQTPRSQTELFALRPKTTVLEAHQSPLSVSEAPAIAAALVQWDRIVAQEKRSKSSQQFRIEMHVGAMQQQNMLKGPESYVYMRKPTDQKSWSMNQEVLGVYERGRFSIAAGLGQSAYRAKLEVRPEVWGWIQQIESSIQVISDTQIVTRQYWVQGNEYQEFVNVISIDSLMVNDTLMSEGWKPAALPEPMPSHNVYSYWEIPIQLGYRVPLHSRWNLTFRGGMRYGLLRRAEGIVPRSDYGAWESLSAASALRKSVWSTQLGLRVSYSPHVRWECYVQPEYRQTTSSIWDAALGVNERFRSWGLQAGVSYRFGK